MPNYKLVYFNGRGRGELIRYIFAVAGQKYEDDRIDREAWPALKPKTIFGQVPVLYVDGVELCQSGAMARYLAKQFGLAGKSALDEARVDMVADCVEDMIKPLPTIAHEKDEARKAELKKKFEEEQFPDSLTKFEALLKRNHGGDGYFVGTELTWCDLALAIGLDFSNFIGVTAPLDKYPKLKAFKHRVENNPRLAEWIKTRPQTPF